MNFDDYENEILNAIENDNILLKNPTIDEINYYRNIGQETIKKDKRITLRLYSHDYEGIQKKALELGIPYQTLISGLIHQYIEGKIQIKGLG